MWSSWKCLWNNGLWDSDSATHGDGTGRTTGLGSLLLSERAAEERWWAGELAGLRRQAFATPHD